MLGCLGRIGAAILGMLGLALLLDVISLVYIYWWVVVLIIVGLFLWRRIRRGRTDANGNKIVGLNRLVKAAASDGMITQKERKAIINNRIKAGMDPEEAEIIVDAHLKKKRVKIMK